MSSSIAIPAGVGATYTEADRQGDASKAAGSSSSSYSSSPMTPQSAKSSPPSSSEKKPQLLHHRRPSLLSSAISKQEAHVVNIGDPEGTLRLISYLSSGQGYLWNPEIFLPSYVDCDYTPLENRREPVHDILLSDEEIAKMYPH